MLTQQFRDANTTQYMQTKLEDGTTTQSQYSMNSYLANFNGGSPYSSTHSSGSGVHWAVAIGTGDTEPTFEDYSLASKTSPSDMVYVSASAARKMGHMMWSITTVFRNDSSSPITIKEVGLLLYTNSTANNKGIMIARSLLETPVTIGVGETYAFTYNIEV